MQLTQFINDCGLFFYPLALLLIAGSVLIVERIYMIIFVYNADGTELMKQVQRLILENNIDEAVKLCNSNKNAAVYQVIKAALVNADRPMEEIQDHVEVASLSVIPKLQQRMPYLFTIANVATLIGLLGTITGLITTFQAVGGIDDSHKQELISSGISVAMNATAFGLIIAIPCSLVYGVLFNRINTIIDDIEQYSARILVLLRTGSQYFENFKGENGDKDAA